MSHHHGVFSIENWLLRNERVVNEMFEYIVYRIKKDVYINNPITFFNLHEEKLYDYLVRYLYKVSNNKNKNLARMR